MLCVQYTILDEMNFARTSRQILRWNVVAVAMVYLILLVLWGRLKGAMISAHCLLVFLGLVDFFVYQVRENEFTVSDLGSIGTGLSVAGKYRFHLHIRGAIAILVTILFVIFLVRLGIKGKYVWRTRLLGLAALAAASVFLHSRTLNMETQTWELKAARQNGYILNFMLQLRDMRVSEPEAYSLDTIAGLEKTYSDAQTSSVKAEDLVLTGGKKPTVIAIMDESFADLNVLGDLVTNEEVMPFISSMKENTVRGYSIASVFGAKTPNSEWEYLTGHTMGFLPEGSVVFQQFIGKKPTSLVSNMKNMGYTTVAMHPYFRAGWRRSTVYPKLGFDEMHFMDDGDHYFDETRLMREYITDQEMFDKIIARYEQKSADEPLFLFGVTMQNHGGYGDYYPNFQNDIRYQGGYYEDVNQYLSLARQTDLAIRNLITYFEQVDEPVEVVFFGDHQPSLNSYFYHSLNGKGMSGLTMDELENFYKVPFFVWTNYRTESRRIEVTSMNYLSTLTLQQAGLPLDPYHSFMADMMEEIPAMNSRGYYSLSRSGFYHYEEAKGEEKKWLEAYETLQYNDMFDKKHRSPIFFPYLEGE